MSLLIRCHLNHLLRPFFHLILLPCLPELHGLLHIIPGNVVLLVPPAGLQKGESHPNVHHRLLKRSGTCYTTQNNKERWIGLHGHKFEQRRDTSESMGGAPDIL